jgi:hypothetical protein
MPVPLVDRLLELEDSWNASPGRCTRQCWWRHQQEHDVDTTRTVAELVQQAPVVSPWQIEADLVTQSA